MNVQKFYEIIDGNYGAAKARLLTDERISKYLQRFPSYVNNDGLAKAVKEKDYSTVFAISHEIKGMCLNLELTPISNSSSALCEAVRGGIPKIDIVPLFEKFETDLALIIKTLEETKD